MARRHECSAYKHLRSPVYLHIAVSLHRPEEPRQYASWSHSRLLRDYVEVLRQRAGPSPILSALRLEEVMVALIRAFPGMGAFLSLREATAALRRTFPGDAGGAEIALDGLISRGFLETSGADLRFWTLTLEIYGMFRFSDLRISSHHPKRVLSWILPVLLAILPLWSLLLGARFLSTNGIGFVQLFAFFAAVTVGAPYFEKKSFPIDSDALEATLGVAHDPAADAG